MIKGFCPEMIPADPLVCFYEKMNNGSYVHGKWKRKKEYVYDRMVQCIS